jgi:aspartate aminotransferase/aminotransferase
LINSYIQAMPRSGIRRIMDIATAADVLHLEVGQPDFATPQPVLDAACLAAQDPAGRFTGYTPNMGYASLRKALVAKLQRRNQIETDPDHVLITPGSNYGIMIALMVLSNAGDEVLIPDPGYVNYASLPPQFGARIVRYPLRRADAFVPCIESIARRITPQTKLIVHNSPSNPTGAVCSEAFVRDLVSLARDKNLFILSDEAYEHIVFEGRHISPARYDTDGRVISIFSFSKSYAMTGWRVAYVVAADPMAAALEKQQELCISCAPSISQKAAEAALALPPGPVEAMVDAYRRRRDLALEILRKHDMYAYTPHGAFYILVDISAANIDSDTFADRLLHEQGVAVAPGATFGPQADRYIRVSLAASEKVVAEGLEKTCAFIKANTHR